MTGAAGGTRTLTLLFTDLELSTRVLQDLGDERYAAWLDDHHRILRDSFTAHGGREHGSEGDALFFAFDSAGSALRAALAGQIGLGSHAWAPGIRPRVRMGLHTGEVLTLGTDLRGLTVHQAARICAAAHGGQILASNATAQLGERALPGGASLAELGRYRLKDLAEQVGLYQVHHADLRSEFPPPRTLDAHPHNLPVQQTPLVGRVRELEEIRGLVLSPDLGLLTLSGAGGIGKTRLAVQVAAELADQFADGVSFVDLAPLRDPARVPTTILKALGAEEESERSHLDALLDFLRERRLLLVLDNFEQVLPAADVVSQILHSTQGVKILVTSRAVLRLRGECEYEVPSMRVAGDVTDVEAVASADATALFLQCALAVNPSFALTQESAIAVTEVCSRLDGLPLAIELAASRSKVLAPTALLERLESRLEMLASDRRDAPERQRTMRGAIRWSYELLDEGERRALRRFSVFRGGCTIDAAEAVCGSLDVLAALVDRSLVRRTDESDGTARFGMLDTIREFAGEELEASGEATDARRAHAEWFATWAGRASEALRGGDQARWLDAAEGDIDNIRAVIEWSRSDGGDAELGLGLVAALDRFWRIRGHSDEIWPALEELLARLPQRTLARAKGLLLLGRLRIVKHDEVMVLPRKEAEQVHPTFGEAVAIAKEVGDRRVIAEALLYEAKSSKSLKGSKSKAYRPRFEEALSLATEVGDEELQLEIRAVMGAKGIREIGRTWQELSGTYLVEERLAAARSRGDHAVIGRIQLARARSWPTDPDGSKMRMAEESLRVARELGDARQEAESLLALGKLAAGRMEFESAGELLMLARDRFEALEDHVRVGSAVFELLSLARDVGDRESSSRFVNELGRLSKEPDADTAARIGYRFGRFLRSGRMSEGMMTVLAGASWAVALGVLEWGPPAAAILATTGWLLSASIRGRLQGIGRRRRTPGSLAIFPFTALTLLASFLAYVTRRPAVAVVVVLIIALPRYRGRATALSEGAKAIGAVAGAAALAGAVVQLAGLEHDIVSYTVLAASTAFIVMFGIGVRSATPIWRAAQTGWFLVRFGWPVLAITGLAMHRGLDPEPWYAWASWSTIAGVFLFGVALVVDGGPYRLPGLILIAGTVCLGLTLNGSADLARIGGVLFGLAWAAIWAAPKIRPQEPIVRLTPPDERHGTAPS